MQTIYKYQYGLGYYNSIIIMSWRNDIQYIVAALDCMILWNLSEHNLSVIVEKT